MRLKVTGGSQDFARVPAGHVWVEGDCERFSVDSNTYGAVPAGLVNARVLCKVWPLSEAAALPRREAARDKIITAGGASEPPRDSWLPLWLQWR